MPADDTLLKRATPPRNWRTGFWSLIATQFQGAFSENALKNLIIFLVFGLGLSDTQKNELVPIVMIVFAMPFIIFSMVGGYFADRFSKRTATIGTKVFEVCSTFIALAGLALKNLPLEFAAIFLLDTQGAVFGPSKYGLLPELLPEGELSWGNGIIELGTFVAVISGTIAAGYLSDGFRGRQQWSGFIFVALAMLGTLLSLGISRVPAANPARKFQANFITEVWQVTREIRKDHVLWLAVLGNTYFWFLGALLQPIIILYGKDVLHLSDSHNGFLQAALAIGIGIGSVAAGYLSGGKIEYGLIPLGAIGLTAFSFALALSHLTFGAVLILLAFLGFFGGFFAVPVNALIQHRPPIERRGAVLATAGVYSFMGIGPIAAGTYYFLTIVLHLSAPAVFLVGSGLTLLATLSAVVLLPDSLLRLLLWMATHSLYRISVNGRENIPERGGALFVANHLSFVDALLLSASTDRHIRYLIYKDIYEHPVIKPFARVLRAIPISPLQRPREMLKSLREASDAIRNGEVVCIFAEGQITRIGQMLPFRHGFERIMKGIDAPIVPVNLDGVWGSIFSFERGRFLWKMPRRIPYPVTVSFGNPVPATSTAGEVRRAVQELQTEAYFLHKKRTRTLIRSLVGSAHRYPFRFAMADAKTPRVRLGGVLTRTIFLARRLRRHWEGQEMVGILLPPSVGGALANFAASLCGKVPVNLNYTASRESLISCAAQCRLQTVVTTQMLLERLKIDLPLKIILLEDVAAHPRFTEKLASMLLWWLPGRWLVRRFARARAAKLDDLATVIFSSGSTGDPKGVMLSHFNIASNIDQMGQTFMFNPSDRLLGVLPFFHSFGFTVTLWLPAVLGVGVVYHYSPLDMAAIGELVRKYKVTFLLATPTFLQAYIRRCQPEDFGSLQFVLVGAEKLPERVALAFEDRFGIRPLEGYGCTECSPAVTVNTHDYRAAGFRQVGGKRGKIGHPLPGISVRIEDAETGAALGTDAPGLLLVRGPNIMQGYLGRPDKTGEVLRDGWYVTGDIAAIDEDGFLTITDRLSRFSKIGGEMVPHVKIEEKLHELAGATETTFLVTGIPDSLKGEKLIVLHRLKEEQLKEVLARLGESGLPNLWIPRAAQFFRIEEFPYLGTGKLDLRAARALALQHSGESNS
ncbi:MAG TPA: acyl-[ACP]--phospholipid O-acyltransferase [Candidatus Acidoferrales bacterium]|nr:acyl-[ACP]--phospholipid O-acyltransferase [Candidatus Acidoferrales bacterium]